MEASRYFLASILVFYGASTLAYFVFLFTERHRAALAGLIACAAGFLLQTMLLVRLAASLGYFPVSTFRESLFFFSWLVAAVYLAVELKRRQGSDGVFVMPLAVSLTAFAVAADGAQRGLPPALQSPWLGVHATLCFLSYACFALACSFGALYLWQEHEVKSRKPDKFFFRLPALESLDRLGYRAIAYGFVFLTLGMASGAAWAQQAWGRFWNWDPKETWSLVMWLLYLLYLHGRIAAGWRGRRSAYLAIAGFCVVLFTYLGVSFLFTGLHSYLQ